VTVAELAVQAGLSLAAFVVGVLVGRVERMAADGKPIRQRWRDLGRVGFALVVIVVVVVSYWSDRYRITCEQRWFEDASVAIAERWEAAGRTNTDLRQFADASLRALEHLGEAREPIREALVELRDSLDQAAAVHRDARLPSPPEC
jgi:hypothetical protein